MPDDLGFFDYVKAAFGWKVHLGWLGHLSPNKLLLAVFGALGFANPGFWFAGLACEAAYLWLMADSRRFKNVVQGRRLLDRREASARRHSQVLIALEPASKQRYSDLVRKCSEIFGTTEIPQERDLRVGGVGQLLGMFLKLLLSRQRIQVILSQTSSQKITAEIQEAVGRLERAEKDSPLHRTLQGTLDIQKRRLENYLKAGENMKIIDAELERIEHQVRLLAEEAPVSGDAEVLTMRLDGVMQSLQGTSTWMAEHEELFSAPGEAVIPAPDLIKAKAPLEKG